MARLVPCPTCGGMISSNSPSCVHCGERNFDCIVRTEQVCTSCDSNGWLFHTDTSGDSHPGPDYYQICVWCLGTKNKHQRVSVLQLSEHNDWTLVPEPDHSKLLHRMFNSRRLA